MTAFRYLGYRLVPRERRLVCDYGVEDGSDTWRFREEFRFPGHSVAASWATPEVAAAARLVFLLAGVSYYKTKAPPLIDLGETALTDAEREFLRSYYLDGLGEFAYRNALDLSGLRITGPVQPRRAAAGYDAVPGRPLIPFGGGVDSITTVELITGRAEDAALFVVNRPEDRFEAIERPAGITGLPVVRAERIIDDQVLRSAALGFRNGHVPVTGILSAAAVMAAVLDRRDAVVMSNEWSSSVGTIVVDGRSINHQYSKSLEFEAGLREFVRGSIGGGLEYFSALRPFTELWIAQRFAGLTRYFDTFRSCNRAFHIDPAKRFSQWCGACDKCCFIDLILAPFLDPSTLDRIFGGREPLMHPGAHFPGDTSRVTNAERIDVLVGLSGGSKPWECVGDVTECQAAALLSAARPDRAGNRTLHELAAQLRLRGIEPAVDALLRPLGKHFIPRRYAIDALLV